MDREINKGYFAVLGDLHGHITLAYRLLRRWETENEKRLDTIFQVGDFGIFPPPFRVDKATMRFYEKDADELSFKDYYEGSEEADEILDPDSESPRKIQADTYFIKGNHEDFIFLSEIPDFNYSDSSVDAYGRIFYLKNGGVYSIQVGGSQLCVAALGGVDPKESAPEGGSKFTRSEHQNLFHSDKDIDIFLSHDVPYDSLIEGSGSPVLQKLIEELQPAFHFCGHYHEPGQELEVEAITNSFHLNEVGFRRSRMLNPGCIAIGELTSGKITRVEILQEEWMSEYTRENFRDL